MFIYVALGPLTARTCIALAFYSEAAMTAFYSILDTHWDFNATV